MAPKEVNETRAPRKVPKAVNPEAAEASPPLKRRKTANSALSTSGATAIEAQGATTNMTRKRSLW